MEKQDFPLPALQRFIKPEHWDTIYFQIMRKDLSGLPR